ncbi:glycosyl transferase [Emericellopsis cladophorae]|uniref:Glycosyl transferase n=1 Tax=Emericellopsis cladophorae TaxID=2686198 RepID=A0A9P9XUB3_9HYPO|nr:glycosyl transferase [Emericellopsis cladophorae]KAI6777924.1 glycosyl transferase [Emericellopsis cladophorae]
MFQKRLLRLLFLVVSTVAPGGWVRDDTERLYGEHDDVESNIAGLKQGDPLPEHDDMDAHDRPEWAFDYSCTYLLHAFSLSKPRDGVKHNRITPKYVLEKRSNFGRAVYPIAKELYDKGIITIDETL